MIRIKKKDEIKRMEIASEIASEALDAIRKAVKPGINTKELELIADDVIKSRGGKPAFKGYKGFPSTICASPNDVIVHGIPSERVILKEGDILSIDLGVIYKGYIGDVAITLPVGKITESAERLLNVARRALYLGIEQARPKNRVGDISYAIQNYVESQGYSVVRKFVGHGVGRKLHEDPQVPNFGSPGKGPLLKAGMTLAIEPMVNEGSPDVIIMEDGWTARTKDGKLSAHFEHTIVIEKRGPRILTYW